MAMIGLLTLQVSVTKLLFTKCAVDSNVRSAVGLALIFTVHFSNVRSPPIGLFCIFARHQAYTCKICAAIVQACMHVMPMQWAHYWHQLAVQGIHHNLVLRKLLTSFGMP